MRVRLTLAMVALSCRLAVLGAHGLADWIPLAYDMADVRVEDGVLKGRVARRDPFFRVRLKEPFTGSIDHVLRIKARATHLASGISSGEARETVVSGVRTSSVSESMKRTST